MMRFLISLSSLLPCPRLHLPLPFSPLHKQAQPPLSLYIYRWKLIFLLLPSCPSLSENRANFFSPIYSVSRLRTEFSLFSSFFPVSVVMVGLNPLALEFYPCLGAAPSSFSFQLPYPASDCFYTPLSPFLPLLPNYCLPFSGTIESPYLSPPTLSVCNNSLHLYLDFPAPVKVPDLISYSTLCGLPLGVLEGEGKVVTGEEVLQGLRHRSEAKNRANRYCRRRREEYSPRREKALWVAKGRGRVVEATRKEVMKSPPHEAVQVIGGENKSKTTLMIRNIPNKFTRKMLLDFLDGHCREEASSAYDFVYLPMDFGSGCNLGYAFVNFTNSTATGKLHRVLHRKKWDVLGSKKICEINFAKIQGVEALQRHFEKSIFACESDEYLPVRFHPFRDGTASPFESRKVGNRVPRVPVLPAD